MFSRARTLDHKNTLHNTGCLRDDVQSWCSAVCRSASRSRDRRESTHFTSSPSRMCATSGSDGSPAKPKAQRMMSGFPVTAARCAVGTSARRTTARTSRSASFVRMRFPPSSPRPEDKRNRRGKGAGLPRTVSQLTASCQKRRTSQRLPKRSCSG